MKKIIILTFLISGLGLGLAVRADNNDLAKQLSGRLLLATESAGQVWYVDPETGKREYLGAPADFLASMKRVALGVSKKDFDAFKGVAPSRLAGKFLLLVDEAGKIAYVNPADLKIYKFNNAQEALQTIRQLSLGISNENLNKISSRTAANVGTGQPVANQAADKNLLDKLKKIAQDYINGNLLSEGTTATVTDIKPAFGLHELTVKLSTSTEPVVSYISNDGTKFFPQGLDITAAAKVVENTNTNTNTNTQANANITTTAVPTVELFVMSHCPYGTQMEKGLLPVLQELGNSVDFKLKFVYYAMHGQKEVTEQMNQYCIQQEQPTKLLPYLQCFLAAGDGAGCLTSTGVDQTKLATCVASTDASFGITAGYNDQSTWLSGNYPLFNIYKADNTTYGVSGSPTLVVNGQKVSSSRDSASLLKTVCQYFTTKPAACSATLSSSAPSAGFGFNVAASSNTTAGCGN